jgi:sugar/nucleoside kinase (ribokinase family)
MFFVTGDLNIDVTTAASALPPAGKEAQAQVGISFGGQGGNVAFFLRCLCQQTQLFGTLGNDTAGLLYMAYFDRIGAVYAGDVVDEPTGMVSVVQEAGSYHMYRQRGANQTTDLDRFFRFLHEASATPDSHLFISGYSLLNNGCAETLEAALEKRDRTMTVVALDPSSIDAMRSIGREAVLGTAMACDYLFPNDEEARWLAQETDAETAARTLVRLTGATAVVKLGERGALLCSRQETLRVPGISVTPLDVTGAGDAFAAAFLTALGSRRSEQLALQDATAFSAAKVQLSGTQPSKLLQYL